MAAGSPGALAPRCPQSCHWLQGDQVQVEGARWEYARPEGERCQSWEKWGVGFLAERTGVWAPEPQGVGLGKLDPGREEEPMVTVGVFTEIQWE